METLILILKIVIIGTFVFFFFLGLRKKLLLECILIVSIYPTISSIIGQETGKSLLMIFFYSIIFFMLIRLNRRRIPQLYFQEIFNLSYLLLLLLVVISLLISPAMGYDYYTSKIVLSVIEIIIPLSLLILISDRILNFNPRFLFRLLEIVSLLAAILVLLNAYKIGISNILASKFMTRVALEDSNVIWTGRLISIGFVLVLLRKGDFKFKLIKLIVLVPAMILTGSKAVILFPIISVLIYILYFNKTKYNGRNSKIKLVTLIAFTAFVFFYIISQLNPMAVEQRFSLKSNSIDSRQSSIDLVWDSFLQKENILIGNGYATAGYPIEGNYNINSYPHNLTVEILYELGIIGLILFYSPTFISIWFSKKYKMDESNFSILTTILVLFFLYAQTSGNINGNSFLYVLTAYIFYIAYSSFKGRDRENNRIYN